MRLIDADDFDCENCRHHRTGKCDTYCEVGEQYSPDITKLTIIDPESLRPQWIPVEERVPGTERVLVTDGESVIKAARRFDGVWRMEQLICKPITHWMPLPEPPTNGVAERR